MAITTCIYKHRVGNKIIGYRLKTEDGQIRYVSATSLKQLIPNGIVTVDNLTLTKDGRLIDKTNTKKEEVVVKGIDWSNEETVKKYIGQNRLLGRVKEIRTYCKHAVYLLTQDELHHVLYIPANVTCPNKDYLPECTKHFAKLKGNLFVVGGKGLISATSLFSGCLAYNIDLTYLCTAKVTDMSNMFNHCESSVLDLTSLNTEKVKDMHNMFYYSNARYIDMSSFKTPNLIKVESMFEGCKVERLNVSTLNTKKVESMKRMFKFCQATEIIFGDFQTQNVSNMCEMFMECKVASLNLNTFNTSNVWDMFGMFKHTVMTRLIVNSFDISTADNMKDMFRSSLIEELDLSSFVAKADSSCEFTNMFKFNNLTKLVINKKDNPFKSYVLGENVDDKTLEGVKVICI